MKPLIPSHKENKRYLLIKGNNLKQNIEKAILEFSGVLGLSKCGLSFIKNDIICVNREAVDLVRASLAVFPGQELSIYSDNSFIIHYKCYEEIG